MTSDTGISIRQIRRIARDEVQQAFAEDSVARRSVTGSAEDGGAFVFLVQKASR